MRAGAQEIQRPWALAAVVVLLICGAAGAVVSLWSLRGATMNRPDVLVRDVAVLEETLATAPFAGPELSPAAIDETVWVVARTDCEGCPERLDALLKRLDGRGLETQLLLSPPRAAAAGSPLPEVQIRLAATLARTRDRSLYEAWRGGEAPPSVIEDPAELDGYIEFSRQSAERLFRVLIANEIDPGLPLVVWREGRDWRVITGADANALRWVETDDRSGA